MGVWYNKDIQQAKTGDILRFNDGLEVELESVIVLDMESPIAKQLCRNIYNISLKQALEIWKNNAILQGNEAGVVSSFDCLWVCYKTPDYMRDISDSVVPDLYKVLPVLITQKTKHKLTVAKACKMARAILRTIKRKENEKRDKV